jgi:hypothetical protein
MVSFPTRTTWASDRVVQSQAEVLAAGDAALGELDLQASARTRPQIASMQVITNVSPYQSQLLNRFTAA